VPVPVPVPVPESGQSGSGQTSQHGDDPLEQRERGRQDGGGDGLAAVGHGHGHVHGSISISQPAEGHGARAAGRSRQHGFFCSLLDSRPMAHAFLDDAAGRALTDAVARLEAASAVEVVVAVRRSSALWLHVHVVVGAVATMAALAYMLFSRHAFGLVAILVDPFVIGAVAAAGAELAPTLKRLMTPLGRRRAAARRAAAATFLERGVHHTAGRSGLLVYLSVVERVAILVGDVGLDQAWPAPARAAAERELGAAMARGGAATAAALAGLADALAAAMPRHAADRNELPDAVDARLSRQWRVPS
jgi:putative membrane protein